MLPLGLTDHFDAIALGETCPRWQENRPVLRGSRDAAMPHRLRPRGGLELNSDGDKGCKGRRVRGGLPGGHLLRVLRALSPGVGLSRFAAPTRQRPTPASRTIAPNIGLTPERRHHSLPANENSRPE